MTFIRLISLWFIFCLFISTCSDNAIAPENNTRQKLTQITHFNYGGVYSAKLFPQKTKLLYWYLNVDNYEVRSCDINGSNDQLLVTVEQFDSPTISGDGKKLAFNAYRYTTNGVMDVIYIYEFEMASLTQIYCSDDSGYIGTTTPYAFSPDNTKLLVNVHHLIPGAEINSVGILTISNMNLVLLTGDISACPIAFSKTGQEVLYQTLYQLCEITTDGSNQKVLADQFENIFCKGYSNSTNTVYFTGTKIGDYYAENIYRVNLDGTNLVKITNDSSSTYIADLSVDDKIILYNSNKRTRDLRMDIYQIDSNSEIKVLLQDRCDDRAIGFADQTNKIIFSRYDDSTYTANLYLLEN